jgi:succinyl-CoA synthetase alpha subunit
MLAVDGMLVNLCLPTVLQGYIHKPGKIGIVSRSGTLTYEVSCGVTSHLIAGTWCCGLRVVRDGPIR